MDDDRVWQFESGLWTADADHYRQAIDAECLMVLPHPPFVQSGEDAIAAVIDTPRWEQVELGSGPINCPFEAPKWRRSRVRVVAAGIGITCKTARARDRSHFDVLRI